MEDPTSFYREQRFDSKAWLGVRDLLKEYGHSEHSVLGYVLPSSVWIGYGDGTVRRADPLLPAAGIVDMNAGARWQWASIYTTFGVWRSVESGPQLVSNLSTRSFSEGADLSAGVYKNKWSVSGYVSFSRSSYDDGMTLNNSSNYNASSGVSFTFVLERWPNVTLALDVTKYGDTYLASDGSDTGRATTAGIALDFSKYLAESSGQKLQLFYYARDEGFDSRWGAIQNHNVTLAHVFGGVARSRW